MRKILLAAVGAFALASGSASAGNIVLTGHDDDFHQSSDARAQTLGALSFVRGGSSNAALPVLTFDRGSQLTSLLSSLSIPFTNVNPSSAASITDALFDPTIYSAFAVASEQSCGGCDNTPGDIANIAAHSTAIASFFNAGGGIFGLAAAGDLNGYAYVPSTATNPGGTPNSFNHFQTTAGVTLGITAVNGDATHNFFSEPGTSGLASGYQVVEVENDTGTGGGSTGTPITVAFQNGVIDGGGGLGGGGTGVPEPAAFALLSVGLAGLGALRQRSRG